MLLLIKRSEKEKGCQFVWILAKLREWYLLCSSFSLFYGFAAFYYRDFITYWLDFQPIKSLNSPPSAGTALFYHSTAQHKQGKFVYLSLGVHWQNREAYRRTDVVLRFFDRWSIVLPFCPTKKDLNWNYDVVNQDHPPVDAWTPLTSACYIW